MKKSILCVILPLILLLAVLFSSVASLAAFELPGGVSLEETMQFQGVEAEYSGLNGIRGVFTVKDSEIAKLEAAGYTVTYGAIVGYQSTYPSFSALSLDKTQDAAKITVYRSGVKKEAYFLESENGVSKFALATFFGSKAATEDGQRGMVYRGYLQLEKSGYASQVYYVDGIDAGVGETLSLYRILQYAGANGFFKEDNIFLLQDRFEKATHYVYVDPSAKAGGDGLSAETAVKTPFEGYELAVSIINAADRGPVDVVIQLAPGKHHISKKLNIKGSDITSSIEYSITFQGSKSNEKSIVTSNIDVPASQFKRVSGTRYYSYQLPESAKIDGKFPAFRDLSFDGEMGTLATSQGEFKMLLDSCRNADKNDLNANDRLLYVSQDALGAVEVDENGNVIGDLEFWVQTEWQVHCVHIEHIDYEGSTGLTQDGQELVAIRVKKSDWDAFKPAYYSTLKNRRYWFMNNKAYLDEKGEFWYDETNGTIYAVPMEPIGQTEYISYPVAERLFHLDHAKNLTFRDLDITGTTVNYITKYAYITGQGGYLKREWTNPDTGTTESRIVLPYGAIYANHAENIRITGCSFYAIGGDAVNFRGAVDRVRIYDSSLQTIGGCGIRLGVNNERFDSTQHNKDIVISENYMQNIAVTFNSSTAILVSSVLNMEITHNTILDTAYSAMSIGWSWAEHKNNPSADADSFVNVKNVNIAYNYIENFMTVTQDGGAIYTLGGNASGKTTEYLNSMNHNYVVLSGNISNGSRQWTVFYHDSGASHWHDYDNVLIIDPESPLPNYSYISYQTSAQSYNNLSERYYIIGYRPDYLGNWGTYDEDGNYVPNNTYTEAQWKSYLPDWFNTKYPDWYQKWIVNGERPDIHISWFIAGSLTYMKKADFEAYQVTENADGSVDPTYPPASDHNNLFRSIYLYTDFRTAEGTVCGSNAKAIAEKAGCSSYHPVYGEWSGKQ